MSLESSLANISIKGNTIDQGRFSDGVTATAYTYDQHAWIFGSSLIDGNSFISPTASADMLNIDECSCTITGNKFVRGSTTINSYIRNYGSNDQMIINNMFDQSTTNGGVDGYLTVLGLSTGSTFHSNKNQVIFVPIQLTTGTIIDVSEARYINDATAKLSIANNLIYTEIGDYGTNNLYFIDYENLNSLLPDGIRIEELKIGMYAFLYPGGVISSTPDENQLLLTVTAVDNASANYVAGDNSLLDIKYQIALTGGGDFPVEYELDTTYDIHGNFTAMQGATQYATLSLGDERFRNTKDRMLRLSVVQYMKLSNATGGGVVWRLSPILARCIW